MPKHMKKDPSAELPQETPAAAAAATPKEDVAPVVDEAEKDAEKDGAPAEASAAEPAAAEDTAVEPPVTPATRELASVPEIPDLSGLPDAPQAIKTLSAARTAFLPSPEDGDPILNIGENSDSALDDAQDLTTPHVAVTEVITSPEPAAADDSPVGGPDDESPRPRRSRKLLWLIPAGVLVLAGAGYVAGADYFDGKFLPGTTLNGEDVSMQTYEDVAARKSSSLDGYTLHASGNGLDLTVSAADLGLTCDGNAYVEEATEGLSAWNWPLDLMSPKDLTAEESSSFDEAKLAAIVTPAVEAVTQDTSELENHGILYSAEQGAFVLDERATAKHLNADAVIEVMKQAVLAGETEVTIGDDCLEDATSLTETLNAANALLGAAGTTLSLNGTQVLDIPADLIANWVRFGDDLSVTLDETAVSEWVTANVGALDTAGKERSYTRPDGKQITVSGGTWGIITNEAETTTVLLDAIRGGSAQALEIPLRQSSGVVADANGRDWGNRYIDIDISEQHVRMYDDSGALIWESDCVTGDPTQGYDTPTGVNPINANKGMNQTLKGLDYNGDGEPDYESYVTYWIPFVGNLVALHDADWRYYFGGTIYQGNGSHGCVNLPVGKAAELYELTRVGDCVVVHY